MMRRWCCWLLFVSVVWTYGVGATEPSLSEERRHQLDYEVTLLQQSPHFIATLRWRIERLYFIHTKASVELQKFDDMLDDPLKAARALKSEAYISLTALKRMSEREALEFNYVVDKLLTLAARKGDWGQQNELTSFLEEVLSLPQENLGINPLEWPKFETLHQSLESKVWLGRLVSYSESSQVFSPMILKASAYSLFGLQVANDIERQLKHDVLSRDEDFIIERAAVLKEVEAEGEWYQNIAVQGARCHFPSVGARGNVSGRKFPSGQWALTFDDGPRSKTTSKVFETLKAYGKEATFFWLAQEVLSQPHYVRRAYQYGFEVANHSYSHPDIRRLGARGKRRQITTSTQKIQGVIDSYGIKQKLRFFRLPYGAGYNHRSIRTLIAQNGLVHAKWNVDSMDWQDKNSRSIFKRVWRQMRAQKGGVILFHDTHSRTARALGHLLEFTQSNRNIEYYKLSDLVKKCP